jgi:hypothetical protein
MRLIREKVIGYLVAVNDKPTELCLVDGMADIVEAERGSLKGTRLAFSSKPTLFSYPQSCKARHRPHQDRGPVVKHGTDGTVR